MISEQELAEAIEVDEAKPRKPKAAAVAQAAPVVVGDAKRLVKVRCVVECKPWADGKPLDYWQDYEISAGDAALLESRKFAVILETNSKGK